MVSPQILAPALSSFSSTPGFRLMYAISVTGAILDCVEFHF